MTATGWLKMLVLLMVAFLAAAIMLRVLRPAVRCTHGTSSVGPVTKVDGKLVRVDTTPRTEGCR